MEIVPDRRRALDDPIASGIVELLEAGAAGLGLGDAVLYHDFPLYRDEESLIVSKLLLASKEHGVLVIGFPRAERPDAIRAEALNAERVFSSVYSRLFRQRGLKKSMTELGFPCEVVLYIVGGDAAGLDGVEAPVLGSPDDLILHLTESRGEAMPDAMFSELNSTLSGERGLIRVKVRAVDKSKPKSKGFLVNELEAQIASFDQRQKYGQIPGLTGFERVRGLAGSGKTVVLAMKAAVTHLQYPEARIAYTFYTRSLYQQIRRLITRFYKQFDEREPDWERLQVLHGWGGATTEGVYHQACLAHGVSPMTYGDAQRGDPRSPFGYACDLLLQKTTITPLYDYMFIDEGQDFPIPFVRLCLQLSKGNRVAYAYDDLQTIFQKEAPTPIEIGTVLSDDRVLYKCYRNPREIIVVGHSLGFGIYSSRIVQMLENKAYWEDVGYRVLQGEFREGTKTVIERPKENSLPTISEAYGPEEIVQATAQKSYEDELKHVVKQIKADLADGLRPDDILVEVVDDRHAKSYLEDLSELLRAEGVQTNNIHADAYNVVDFQREQCVTLSTVHKAKGNEAYMVYVIGVDALFSSYATGRQRNILYTAVTRAKGWVRISGVGAAAEACKNEVEAALAHMPNLEFTYPSKEQLRIMRRDLAEKDAQKQRVERMLEEVLAEITPDEAQRFIEQRRHPKGTKVAAQPKKPQRKKR